MADETMAGGDRRSAKVRLGEWATNPLTVFFARVMTGLGVALASGAVWVFVDTRTALRDDIGGVSKKLESVQREILEGQRQVQSVAERVAVQQQQLNGHDRELIEQQRRLNRLEQKVFP